MPKPRKEIVCLETTPYYHCTSRCVRQAFLCGFDSLTNKCYEHRRQWIEDRILWLGTIFTIDVCAYAVMSNHHHVVLHINLAESEQLSPQQICTRWHQLFKGTPLTQRFARGEQFSSSEAQAVSIKLEQYRLQLRDISWFMRLLNEPIARKANAEDQCTGRFWESRFKSQALLDESALVACMAYVDLNPIRAKIAAVPEESDHTSIKKRVAAIKKTTGKPLPLAKFVGNPRENIPAGLPFHFKDYLELIDWTGRIIREDKPGAITARTPPIIDRLAITPHQWQMLTTQFESQFKSLVGQQETLKQATKTMGYQRTPGLKGCQLLL